jgi:hypothetical protein
MKKQTLVVPLQVILVSLLAITVAYLMGPRRFITGGDTAYYLTMAYGETVEAPYAYRVLVPSIVRILPLSLDLGFFVVTYASTFGVLVIMYRLLRELGVSHVSSIITVVLMNFSYPIAFYLSNWGYVDPLANLFFVIGLLFIYMRKNLIASGVLMMGVFAKETLLILLPLLFMSALRQEGGNEVRNLFHALILCLVPLCSFLLILVFISPAEGVRDVHSFDDWIRLWQYIWSYNVGEFGLIPRVARELLRSYGFFWIIAGFGILLGKETRPYSFYLISAGFALWSVATDWSRMLGIVFPGVFIPTAIFVDRMQKTTTSTRLAIALIALAIVQSYLSQVTYRELDRLGKMGLIMGIGLVFLAGTLVSGWGYYSLLAGRDDPFQNVDPA